MDGMMGNGMMGMGIWGFLMLLTVIALLVLGVLGSVWFYRQLNDRRAEPVESDGDLALDRLRKRYAAGEINDEEFERRLSALTHWR